MKRLGCITDPMQFLTVYFCFVLLFFIELTLPLKLCISLLVEIFILIWGEGVEKSITVIVDSLRKNVSYCRLT